jgi:xylulokinase
MYLIGYDLGSSSVKGAIVNGQTGSVVASMHYPETEMNIDAPQAGFAEQNPDLWWSHVQVLTQQLLSKAGIQGNEIKGIGISYQMHGLVVVDASGKPLRPSIIWCDSRAVALGEQATEALGIDYCLSHYLNAPGNFTASKLEWVRQNEPEIFSKIHKMMLPGDYLAYKMSGEYTTTVTGLSEGILYDFETKTLAKRLLDLYQIPESMIPDIAPAVGIQCRLSAEGAAALGLEKGTPIGYRAGDQPNNAMSLNVLTAGEVAATGGTSGVIYAVSDQPVFDPYSRVNSFAHVNYTQDQPYTGVLLCINGAGIQYRWMRSMVGNTGVSYPQMEQEAATIQPGCNGLVMLPFGNGAERMLKNKTPGGGMYNLDFNLHTKAHLYRAALEGIAFAFGYGAKILQSNGIPLNTMKVGSGNLFESAIFSNTIATLTGSTIQVMDTNGAAGAAKAAGVAIGHYESLQTAMQHQQILKEYLPSKHTETYLAAYERWAKYVL